MIANAASIISPATVFYFETELASNNTHKFTNVTALSHELCNSHAGFHAYTGCDQIQIPSFAGRKTNPPKTS